MKQGKAFKRGVHLFDGKELSQDCPIKPIEAGAVMVYPLAQHIGAPAKAVVAVGDRVLKGQLIAEAEGYISAPVHSSVSGTVKAIEPREVVSGGRVDSIVIENDFQEEANDNFGAERNLEDLSADEIDEIVKNTEAEAVKPLLSWQASPTKQSCIFTLLITLISPVLVFSRICTVQSR